jgi:hypothetical protein
MALSRLFGTFLADLMPASPQPSVYCRPTGLKRRWIVEFAGSRSASERAMHGSRGGRSRYGVRAFADEEERSQRIESMRVAGGKALEGVTKIWRSKIKRVERRRAKRRGPVA